MTEPTRSLWIPGKPQPKARPRRAADGHFYSPDPSGWEEIVAGHWLHEHGRNPIAGPVQVFCNFALGAQNPGVFIEVGPAWETMPWHIGRGDCDNYLKSILDALTRIAWNDDRQIVNVSAWKLREVPNESGR